jgi:hypothetical protein
MYKRKQLRQKKKHKKNCFRCTVRSLKQDQEADRGENGRDLSRGDSRGDSKNNE